MCTDREKPEQVASGSSTGLDLRYSKEPPTIPGWYWYKDHHNVERVQQVLEDPHYKGVMTVLENTYCGWRNKRVAHMGLQWAGPIKTPQQI